MFGNFIWNRIYMYNYFPVGKVGSVSDEIFYVWLDTLSVALLFLNIFIKMQ